MVFSQKKSGFSLVELLVTVALCSSLLLFGNAFIEGLRGVEMVKDFEFGVSLARAAIEGLKARPWEELKSIVETDFEIDNKTPTDYHKKINWSGAKEGEGTRYERLIFVKEVPPINSQKGYPTHLKLITVEVKWKNIGGKDLKYTVSTLLSRLN